MNSETLSRVKAEIGAPVHNPVGGRIGHICALTRSPGTYAIGAGGLTRDSVGLVIVWDDFTMTECGDALARMWLEQAAERRIPWLEGDASERLSRARQRRAELHDERKAAQEAEKRSRAAYEAEIAGKIPTWAKAVIVAELVQDQSDSMSDYYGSTVKRSVILGFSAHTRDLFPELRKAARNFPETESLADAPADAERREKYSMGGGYYLKLGGRHWSGWRVEKQSFYGGDPVKRIPQGDWFTGTPAAAAPAKNGGKPEHVTGDAGALIEEHTHSKHGFTMWLAILPGRVPREEFDRLTGEARALGGWYSRPWGKTPGGFAFKVKASAERFAGATPSAPDPDGAPKRDAERMPSPEAPKVAGDKLRTLADAMQRDIDSAFRDRLTNTPKRQREAQSARLEGLRLQRTQAGMRALADMHDAGTAPPVLANVTTRKAAYELAGAEIKRSGGYYDAGHETGKPSRDTEAARAFWALVAGAGDAQRAAFELRQKIEALQFARIPGYFPTPRAVVARMLELAEIGPGALVLEPSAGHGAILDEIKAAHPGARLVAYERHHSLAEIIAAKGYTVDRCDFTEQVPESVYDRVMMNPPFENGQDMQHVRHAFTFLKPGGRLVAVMSPGPFFRQDKAASGFRDWFDDMGGEREDLPAGSFKESGTGVGAVLVTICKGGA